MTSKSGLAKIVAIIIIAITVVGSLAYSFVLLTQSDKPNPSSTSSSSPTGPPSPLSTPSSSPSDTPKSTRSPTQNQSSPTLTPTKIFYTLNLTIIGQGTSNPSAGITEFAAGTTVSLNATPSAGWKFEGWNNTNDNFSNPTTLDMTSNKSIILYLAAPYKAFGLDFSPYTLNGQNPNYGTPISESQIRSLLTTVKPYTEWIRTYGSTNGLENIGRIAHEMNIKVAAQAWLGPNQAGNQKEVANLINIGKAREADLLILGSEVLLRNDLTESQLISYINVVRQAIPEIPVTTADTYGELLSHPAVMNACSVIMPHYYPFWEGISLDTAIYQLNIQNQRIAAYAGGKTVIVGETG